MPRAKSISARRHRKVLKAAKGYKNARSRRVKVAKEAVLHAGKYAYIGRKEKKRDFKKLWITRISAAAKSNEISYSKLVKGLKDQKVELDRKILADIAVNDPETFTELANLAKKSFKN